MEPVIVEPKPSIEVGTIVVDMHVENAGDQSLVALGFLASDKVRTLDMQALVHTGSNYLSLTTNDITSLGLRPVRRRSFRSAAGLIVQQIYSAVRVTVGNRDCLIEVAELPDGSPALIGQVPLELMDYWIDMANKRLVGNPEHGGEWLIDAF